MPPSPNPRSVAGPSSKTRTPTGIIQSYDRFIITVPEDGLRARGDTYSPDRLLDQLRRQFNTTFGSGSSGNYSIEAIVLGKEGDGDKRLVIHTTPGITRERVDSALGNITIAGAANHVPYTLVAETQESALRAFDSKGDPEFLRERIGKLRSTVEALEIEKRAYESLGTAADIQKVIDDLGAEQLADREKLKDLEHSCDTLQHKEIELRTQLEEVSKKQKSEKEVYDAQVAIITNNFNMIHESLDRAAKKLGHNIIGLDIPECVDVFCRQSIERLEASKQNLEKAARLNAEAKTLTLHAEKLDELRSEVNKYKEADAAANRGLARLSNEKRGLEQQLNLRNEEHLRVKTQLEQQLNKAADTEELRKANEALKTAEAVITEYCRERGQSQVRIEDLEQQLKDREETATRLNTQTSAILKERSSRIAELEGTVTQTVSENKSLRIITLNTVDNLTSEELIIEGYKRKYAEPLRNAIAKIDSLFPTIDIPIDELSIALTDLGNYVKNRIRERVLRIDSQLANQDISLGDLESRLQNYATEEPLSSEDQVTYAGCLTILEQAKIQGRGLTRDISAQVRECATKTKEEFERSINRKRLAQNALDELPQIKKQYDDAVKKTASTIQNIPINAECGIFAYIPDSEAKSIRILLPIGDEEAATGAGMLLLRGLAEAVKPHLKSKENLTGAAYSTETVRGAYAITLTYNQQIKDTFDTFVSYVRNSLRNSVFCKLGVNIEIGSPGNLVEKHE